MDIRNYNREAWNRQVEGGNVWTIPVTPQEITEARSGRWRILLTPSRPVPSDWFPPLPGCRVLCLASGGGQQGPILAAAGAEVTVFDNSPRQLEQDRLVADREGLRLRTVEGDMRDLSCFADESFDVIVHPVSNCFVPDIAPVWREAHRVLGPGGCLLSGFANPASYLFEVCPERGDLVVTHALPFSEPAVLSPELIAQWEADGVPLEFGHTLEQQIGGQLVAGLRLTGFYEDRNPEGGRDVLEQYMATFIATRACKT
jgi:SAM-dependent methyltransferase